MRSKKIFQRLDRVGTIPQTKLLTFDGRNPPQLKTVEAFSSDSVVANIRKILARNIKTLGNLYGRGYGGLAWPSMEPVPPKFRVIRAKRGYARGPAERLAAHHRRISVLQRLPSAHSHERETGLPVKIHAHDGKNCCER